MKHIETELYGFCNRVGLYAGLLKPICRNQCFTAFHGVSSCFIFHFPMQTIIIIDNQQFTAFVVQIWFRKKGVYLVTNRKEQQSNLLLENLRK